MIPDKKEEQNKNEAAEMISLRPHHALCMQFFIGKGYSEAFNARMYETLALSPSTLVQITLELDRLCDCCPNHPTGICSTEEKVSQFDAAVSSYCGFTPGEILTLQDFFLRAKIYILDKNNLEKICAACHFYTICSGLSPVDLPSLL